MTLNGYYNEIDFINAINNKFIFELSDALKKLLIKTYGVVNYSDLVLCYKSFKTDKADIVIVINHIKKYISIKSGKNNSVHLEYIKTFEKLLLFTVK